VKGTDLLGRELQAGKGFGFGEKYFHKKSGEKGKSRKLDNLRLLIIKLDKQTFVHLPPSKHEKACSQKGRRRLGLLRGTTHEFLLAVYDTTAREIVG
jgi:hypothetical protein